MPRGLKRTASRPAIPASTSSLNGSSKRQRVGESDSEAAASTSVHPHFPSPYAPDAPSTSTSLRTATTKTTAKGKSRTRGATGKHASKTKNKKKNKGKSKQSQGQIESQSQSQSQSLGHNQSGVVSRGGSFLQAFIPTSLQGGFTEVQGFHGADSLSVEHQDAPSPPAETPIPSRDTSGDISHPSHIESSFNTSAGSNSTNQTSFTDDLSKASTDATTSAAVESLSPASSLSPISSSYHTEAEDDGDEPQRKSPQREPSNSASSGTHLATPTLPAVGASASEISKKAEVKGSPASTVGEEVRKPSPKLPKVHFCEEEGCTSGFARKSDLFRHRKIHTEDKRFVCEDCGKAFIQLSALKVHFRTHSGEKPYNCRVCGRAFGDYSSMLRHEKTHSGVKRYVCSQEKCGRAFSRNVTLVKHMANEHQIVVLTPKGQPYHELRKILTAKQLKTYKRQPCSLKAEEAGEEETGEKEEDEAVEQEEREEDKEVEEVDEEVGNKEETVPNSQTGSGTRSKQAASKESVKEQDQDKSEQRSRGNHSKAGKTRDTVTHRETKRRADEATDAQESSGPRLLAPSAKKSAALSQVDESGTVSRPLTRTATKDSATPHPLERRESSSAPRSPRLRKLVGRPVHFPLRASLSSPERAEDGMMDTVQAQALQTPPSPQSNSDIGSQRHPAPSRLLEYSSLPAEKVQFPRYPPSVLFPAGVPPPPASLDSASRHSLPTQRPGTPSVVTRYDSVKPEGGASRRRHTLSSGYMRPSDLAEPVAISGGRNISKDPFLPQGTAIRTSDEANRESVVRSRGMSLSHLVDTVENASPVQHSRGNFPSVPRPAQLRASSVIPGGAPLYGTLSSQGAARSFTLPLQETVSITQLPRRSRPEMVSGRQDQHTITRRETPGLMLGGDPAFHIAPLPATSPFLPTGYGYDFALPSRSHEHRQPGPYANRAKRAASMGQYGGLNMSLLSDTTPFSPILTFPMTRSGSEYAEAGLALPQNPAAGPTSDFALVSPPTTASTANFPYPHGAVLHAPFISAITPQHGPVGRHHRASSEQLPARYSYELDTLLHYPNSVTHRQQLLDPRFTGLQRWPGGHSTFDV